MGFFDKVAGAFEKKNCSICGAEIKLLGNKKIENGCLCKECEKKLSPFYSDRRHATVSEIQQQLEYRESNKGAVSTFNPTRSLGNGRKILLDEDARKFIVTSSSKWREENPDVIDYSQVIGCDIDVDEDRIEIYWEDEAGNEKSFEPPRYDYEYDVYVKLHINHPYFDEIQIKLNDRSSIEGRNSPELRQYKDQAEEIKDVLMGARTEVRNAAAEAARPKTAVTCPHCSASTIPDEHGRCEYCGGAVG